MKKRVKLLQDWDGHKAGDVIEVSKTVARELIYSAIPPIAEEIGGTRRGSIPSRDRSHYREEERDGRTVFVDDSPEELRSVIPIEVRATDDDDLIEISITSEYPVLVWGESEYISHDEEDIDLSRLAEVGAILVNHDPNQRVATPEKVWLDTQARKTRALIRFGSTPEAQRAKQEVLKDKTLRGVSGGFVVREWVYLKSEEVGYKDRLFGPAWVAVKTEVLEGSLTPIPADPSVGVGRTTGRKEEGPSDDNKTQGGTTMKRKVKLLVDDGERKAGAVIEVDEVTFARMTTGDSPIAVEVRDEPPAPPTPPTRTEPEPEDVDRRIAERVAAERDRIRDIRALGETHSIDVQAFIDDGSDVSAVRTFALETLHERQSSAPSHRVQVTEDGRQSFARAAFVGLCARIGGYVSPTAEERTAAGTLEIGNFSLLRLAEECLRRANMPIPDRPDALFDEALRGPSISSATLRANETITVGTSDFPFILANVANKALLAGVDLADTTYEAWCKIGNLRDFKAASRLKLSEAGKLAEVPEGQTYGTTKFSEQREQLTLKTYGETFNITRQALINDDLDAFSDIPMALGRAAAILPNDLAVEELLGNGNMADGTAIFASAHNNLSESASYNLSTVDKARAGIGNLITLLFQQKAFQHDDVAATEQMKLRLRGKVLLIPPTYWQNAIAAVGSSSFGAGIEGVNPIKGMLEPTIEPTLEDSNVTGYSTSGYYVFTDPRVSPVIEVAFLNGIRTPYMEEVVNSGTAADGRVWKVRLDCIAGRVDWRGAVKEAGA